MVKSLGSKGAVLKVTLRFFEPRLELIFLDKKDLYLHLPMEFEVLTFGIWNVSCHANPVALLGKAP